MGSEKLNTIKMCLKLIRFKAVVKFFCLFVLVYGLLMAPWPGLRATYTKFYIAGAKLLFGSFGSKGVVRFCPPTNDEYVIIVELYNKDHRDEKGNMIGIRASDSSHRAGYLYTTFLFSLILATPVSWRRRGWSLFWGMILMQSFIAFTLLVRILYAFINRPLLSLFEVSPFWKQALSIINLQIAVNVESGFFVSFIIWILVSFWRDDWNRILMRRNDLSNKIQ